MAYDDFETMRVELDRRRGAGGHRPSADQPARPPADARARPARARGRGRRGRQGVGAVVGQRRVLHRPRRREPHPRICHARTRTAPNDELGFFHAMVDRFRTMPKATIAVVEGRVRGGGSELVSSMDMRFADIDRAVFGAARSRARHHPRRQRHATTAALIGRARALEVMLGCADVDAPTAERWGWVNRALPCSRAARPRGCSSRLGSHPSRRRDRRSEGLGQRTHCPIRCRACAPRNGYFTQTLARPGGHRAGWNGSSRSAGQTRDVELDVTVALQQPQLIRRRRPGALASRPPCGSIRAPRRGRKRDAGAVETLVVVDEMRMRLREVRGSTPP